MTKQAKIRFAVVAGMLALAVGAPVASIVLNQPTARAAALPEQEPEAVVPGPDAVRAEPRTVDLPEVRISGTASRPKARPAKKERRCRLHVLEQGGSPSAPFVLACG